MAFHPSDILQWLPDPGADCLVAYSGGMDSHVLLHAMARLRDSGELQGSLQAIHINHQISTQAAQWETHCQKICDALNIPLSVSRVNVEKRGEGLEQAAREARYKAFAEAMSDNGNLIIAHHQDDQAETQLFRLMRGTGIRGLAGIHSTRAFANGAMIRPLLGYTRRVLEAYANQENLEWIEDDSNADESIDRNFLRAKVLPELQVRWPGYRKSLERLAGLAKESQALLEEVGEEDFGKVSDSIHRVSIPKLLEFSEARQRNIVRTWFLMMEASQVIQSPDHYVVDRVFSEIIPAAVDAEPVVTWNKGGSVMEIRRFADHIYAVLPLAVPATSDKLVWHVETPLQMSELGSLFVVETADEGIVLPENGEVEIRFREGGESAKPAGRKTRSLKKILQDYKVPPWWRDKVPLLYINDELAAVGDLFITDKFRGKAEEGEGKKFHQIRWDRSYLHCGY